MTNVYGLVVAKNEEHRYLKEFIEHHQDIFDGLFLFNDHSTDNTVQICSDYGVLVRDAGSETFMDHEGEFRFAAWQAFEEAMKPNEQDWVFAIDADEFLVSQEGDPRKALHSTIELAEYLDYIVVKMKVDEIWDIIDSKCFYRNDGLWNKIKASRLFKYQPNGRWNMKAMGCGSAPTYAKLDPFRTNNINLMHFGYAREEDRKIKYDRYANLKNHGHNNNHIMSIIRRPVLKQYEGNVPDWVING